MIFGWNYGNITRNNIVLISPVTTKVHSTVTRSYSRTSLIAVRSRVQENIQLRRLNYDSIRKIKSLGINRRQIRFQRKHHQSPIRGCNYQNLKVCEVKDSYNFHNKNEMRVTTVNARSLKSKIELIHDLVESKGIDILLVTETWLTDNEQDTIWIASSFMNKSPFRYQQISRSQRKGGGILLLSRFSIEPICNANSPSFEGASWKLTIGNITLCITGVYHPPPSLLNNTTNSMFIDQLSDFLVEVMSQSSNHIVLGDFNIHVNNPNDLDADLLLDSLSALGLDQQVNCATHIKGNTLDLIFVEAELSSKVLKVEPLDFVSDHRPIMCLLNLAKPRLVMIKKQIRRLNEAASRNFQQIYNSVCATDNQDSQDPNTILDHINMETE